jgi:hypothetical protein
MSREILLDIHLLCKNIETENSYPFPELPLETDLHKNHIPLQYDSFYNARYICSSDFRLCPSTGCKSPRYLLIPLFSTISTLSFLQSTLDVDCVQTLHRGHSRRNAGGDRPGEHSLKSGLRWTDLLNQKRSARNMPAKRGNAYVPKVLLFIFQSNFGLQ